MDVKHILGYWFWRIVVAQAISSLVAQLNYGSPINPVIKAYCQLRWALFPKRALGGIHTAIPAN